MKALLILVVLCLAVFAVAQTFGPPQLGWPGPIATSTTQCSTPAAHAASICPVEAPVGVVTYYQWTGSGWAAGGGGAQGPAGPTGPQGPAGPQGIPGPVQSFVSEQCTTSSVGNSGFMASGCKEQ